ncbi:PIN domain-containing protein [Mucilaginibacter ginkgonis]|uniref:PIN domain-containing protein n=1 Tax=Mucilaginibacter ginkgonis TaxID=2682091 RepID=A0A6I4INM2_9SPHI|nr:PIN domain-containing protein [Mucilaginibacter ginkgonis]QQL48846.1 PIN domain-containing protein [Mucilaginibacter ginkgonis]
MNGNSAIIDSNILIYFLIGKVGVQKFFRKYECAFSFISELEVLSGANGEDLLKAKNVIAEYRVIEYLPAIRDIVIDIRSKKKIKLADAIIAATAIYLKYPLISSDKGFFGIDGLDFVYHEPGLS